MTKLDSINWTAILKDMCDFAEDRFDIQLMVDKDIIKEIEIMVEDTLISFNLDNPNVAKVASVLAFWIRKLKSIFHQADSVNKFLAINEFVGLIVGLSICKNYFDNSFKEESKIPSRVFTDWVNSFRKNSHSPHSSVISFELLTKNSHSVKNKFKRRK